MLIAATAAAPLRICTDPRHADPSASNRGYAQVVGTPSCTS